MSTLLNFEFLAILNFFVLLFGSWSGYFVSAAATPATPNRLSPISWIVIIITCIVWFGDVVFLVLKMTGH